MGTLNDRVGVGAACGDDDGFANGDDDAPAGAGETGTVPPPDAAEKDDAPDQPPADAKAAPG